MLSLRVERGLYHYIVYLAFSEHDSLMCVNSFINKPVEACREASVILSEEKHVRLVIHIADESHLHWPSIAPSIDTDVHLHNWMQPDLHWCASAEHNMFIYIIYVNYCTRLVRHVVLIESMWMCFWYEEEVSDCLFAAGYKLDSHTPVENSTEVHDAACHADFVVPEKISYLLLCEDIAVSSSSITCYYSTNPETEWISCHPQGHRWYIEQYPIPDYCHITHSWRAPTFRTTTLSPSYSKRW